MSDSVQEDALELASSVLLVPHHFVHLNVCSKANVSLGFRMCVPHLLFKCKIRLYKGMQIYTIQKAASALNGRANIYCSNGSLDFK